MALLWIDSFDHYATADLPLKYTYAANATIQSGGRRGSNRLATNSNAFYAGKTIPTPTSTVVFGVAIKPLTFGGSGEFINVLSAGTVQLTLGFTSAGFARVARGTGTANVLGTATTAALVAGLAFYFVELKAVIHPSAGSVVVRVDGVTVINVTGVNTSATGGTTWDTFQMSGSNAGGCDFDDLYVLDGTGAAPLNDFLGDVRVDARAVTGAGATTGWTPSTGANWQNVDDATPNGDTDYNSTSTVGATDTFPVQDAPIPGALVYGAQLSISLKKTDAGVCTVAPVVRHAGVDNVGPSITPATAYAYLVATYGLNPGTGAAWTEAGFNAAEFGYKRTA